MSQKKIKIEYYKTYCAVDEGEGFGKDKAFDLLYWIERAKGLDLNQRVRDYYSEKARLDSADYDEDARMWVLSFSRLRETNIPNIAKEDQEAEPIELEDDEYIGETACAIYDDKRKVLILQRNIHSLGSKGIEQYMNLIWNEPSKMLFLRPIKVTDTKQTAKEAAEIRKIIIAFADMKKKAKEGFGDEEKTVTKIFDGLSKYEGVNAQITITMGRERGESLSKSTIDDTIEEAIKQKDHISKLEVALKRDETSSVEVLDLFDQKLHDFIFVDLERRKTISMEYLTSRMLEKYRDSLDRLQKELDKIK